MWLAGAIGSNLREGPASNLRTLLRAGRRPEGRREGSAISARRWGCAGIPGLAGKGKCEIGQECAGLAKNRSGSHPPTLKGIVSGRDFSRAARASKDVRGSAPEGFPYTRSYTKDRVLAALRGGYAGNGG
jgi:hypothetical protein